MKEIVKKNSAENTAMTNAAAESKPVVNNVAPITVSPFIAPVWFLVTLIVACFAAFFVPSIACTMFLNLCMYSVFDCFIDMSIMAVLSFGFIMWAGRKTYKMFSECVG